MALVRTKGVPFALGGKVTAAELNAIDQNIEGALDKRAANADTLQSLVTLATTGRFIQVPTVGADADTTYVPTDPIRSIRVTSAVLADRVYTLGATGAEQGDRVIIFCDSAFNFEITVKNHDATILWALGFKNTSEGPWCEFIYVGADWHVMGSGGAHLKGLEYLASDTLVVPRNVYFVDIEHVGGGGGGGGGAGSGSAGNGNAPGGGGARLVFERKAVVPGETLTIAIAGGGAGGTGGAISAEGTAGGHGGDTTVTGSTSGLLSTARGAMGGVQASYASIGFTFGGLPYQLYSTYVGVLSYPFRGVVPQTVAGGVYPTRPVPGQGGMGGDTKPVDYTHGGGTAQNRASFGVTVASDGTGGGGSSEWPGGIGGNAVSSNNFNKGPVGNAGQGPGAGGAGGGGGVSAHAGGAGGGGYDGACRLAWVR